MTLGSSRVGVGMGVGMEVTGVSKPSSGAMGGGEVHTERTLDMGGFDLNLTGHVVRNDNLPRQIPGCRS